MIHMLSDDSTVLRESAVLDTSRPAQFPQTPFTWLNRGATVIDMDLSRALVVLVISVVLGPKCGAQPPQAPSTRSCKFGEEQVLSKLVAFAYLVPEYLIEGPAWMRTRCIKANVVPEKSQSSEEFRRVLQGQLADLVQLVAHTERKEITVYVLRLPDDGTPFKLQRQEGVNIRGETNYTSIRLPGFPLSFLAEALSLTMSQPVIDETGLPESFNIALTWNDRADLPKLTKDQLGLELSRTKRPIDVLIVDRVGDWSRSE